MICPQCGKEFYCENPAHNRKFCSEKCSQASCSKRRREKVDSQKEQKICPQCGKSFIKFGRGANAKYCCEECAYQAYLHKCCESSKQRALNKREEVNATKRAYYAKNAPTIRGYFKNYRLKKAQELASNRQLGFTPSTDKPNPCLTQGFETTLGIKRLTETECLCLKCGKPFKLYVSIGNAMTYLGRLVKKHQSPCPFCGEAPTGIPHKGTRSSTPEYEIQRIFPNFTVHGYHPDWMEGLEIDLYDPVAKVGLEYHGIRAHSTAMKSNLEASKIHEHKADLCDANGVQLIQLYETEWLQKRDIVVDKLNAIFHKDMKRVYARKLKVVLMNDPVNRQAALKFLDKNHIQGKASSQWAVGLCDGIELVAVCTFKYGTAYANGGQAKGTECYWELNRYATKLGYSVVGGLSRCIKSFVRNHPEVHTIVSFADRRWTSPIRSAYSSSGFVEKERIRPNYMYSDLNPQHPLRNKQYMRKSNIAKRGESCYSPDKTETEMSKELGFYKIYDAGKIRYEMSI